MKGVTTGPSRGLHGAVYTQIEVRVGDDGVCTVSLNRPHCRNAISRVMTNELDDCFSRAERDPRVRVVVLRGNGKHFSSGHDLGTDEHVADLRRDPYSATGLPTEAARNHFKWSEQDVEMCLRWRQLRKPLVVGVKGFCIYHACALLAVSDMALAADDAKIMPSLVEFTSLPWDLALGARQAKDIMMTQRFVLAPEAAHVGLVNRVVPTQQLDAELARVASALAKGDPFHLTVMKQAVNNALDTAGYTASMRSGFAHWMAYRAHFAELGKMAGDAAGGAGAKRLAPVAAALAEPVWGLSRAASAKL